MTMKRRKFVSGSVRGGLGLLGASAVWANPAEGRPNVFFAISDDQSWIHTGSAGDPVIKTPTIDRVAREGVRFTHAFCCSPSCTPSRSAILTGQDIWRLEEAGNLWSTLRKKFQVYPDLLEAAGYHVGHMRKGWGPGNYEAGGRTRNPAGPAAKNFAEFHRSVPDGKPFCFWFGSYDPHRPYKKGSGLKAGMKIGDVRVPPFLPDTPEVRSDILDYYVEVQRFDRQVGEALQLLEQAGALDNTIVVITSDNGMPFPRAKTNLYDYGVRMPLVVRWPEKVKGGRVVDDFTTLADLAPTFLEAVGLKPLPEMTGRSLLEVLTSGHSGGVDPKRSQVVVGRERHTIRREGGVGYPMRAIRTGEFLYIRNYEPDRWPAGDPPQYGDIDPSPTRTYMLENRDSAEVKPLFELACGKRPAEELYDLKADPGQLNNVAGLSRYDSTRKKLRAALHDRLVATEDPRELGKETIWDSTPYYGKKPKQ